MVAKITVPNSIQRALNYNEQKMKEGKAECIYVHNFLKESAHLNFYEKLNRFEDLISLNKRATTNAVHISLNFALQEKIEKEKLIEIASVYMDKIGFREQPYLVYQHLDAGHPHIHIVTTNIEKNGKRISLHNIGKNQSAIARKEIEIIYKLVKAEDQKKLQPEEVKPLYTQRMTYGKSLTKRSITNVLDAVIPNYKYASLPELNAILKLYNLTADRGKEEGIIFKKRGLVYRALDEKGNKIGVPIKASSIYNKPTLSFLEEKIQRK
ncbi:MAG: relaxase/mobilization nuclease domain-containing protein [Bacteroidota bacterium]|nr:relaxase/mobilization nuclease domain-containing protein [Bacteroidota bacterium]